MRKQYIKPETELTESVLNASVLQVSLNVDGNSQSGGDGDDDTEGLEGDVNKFNLWEE